MEHAKLYDLDHDVVKEYENFRLKRMYRWVMFALDNDSRGRLIQVKYMEKDRKLGLEGLQKHMSKMSAQHCKFVVYDHEYESRDKRKTDKLFFITWSPEGAPGAMNFMNSRQVLRDICEGCQDVFARDVKQLRSTVLAALNNGEAELQEDDDEDDDDDDWIDGVEEPKKEVKVPAKKRRHRARNKTNV